MVEGWLSVRMDICTFLRVMVEAVVIQMKTRKI